MKRVLEKEDMGLKITKAYNCLKTLNLVNAYFLKRALELCPKGKILDVGCGTGEMLRNIKGEYKRYGLDISEDLIQYAKKHDPNSRYTVGDSDNMPYDSGTFDLVMCHSMLHHLEDPRKTIKEILRVAKPEGAIFIRDLIRPASEKVLQRLFLEYLAGHYDEQNRMLFENSLRSGFTHDEWKWYFTKGIDTSQVFFYNIAERPVESVKIDLQGRKVRETEFILKRLIEPILES